MLNKVKDLAYRGIVKSEAEAIASRLGNKEAIVSYLGGEDKGKVKIPDRKSAYELLYEQLMEVLDEEDAVTLLHQKDLFVLRKKLSILWESFEDKQLARETENKRKQLSNQQEVLQRQLEKATRIEEKVCARKIAIQAELASIQLQLGKSTETAPTLEQTEPISLAKEAEYTEEESINWTTTEETVESAPVEQPSEVTQPEDSDFELLEKKLYGEQQAKDITEPVDLIGSNFN